MSDPSAFGFGQFVPGFDFLQNPSKTASTTQAAGSAGMPGMGNWVAPTLSIEDIDKRIQELKSVLFWLEQNTTALKATIQAMEVQKMTLTTLQNMNVSMADLAKAFTAPAPATASEPAPAADATTATPRSSLFKPKPSREEAPPEPQTSTAAEAAPTSADDPTTQPAVDPMQWWGALTQQFQEIAAAALKDVAGEAMKAGMSAGNAATSPTAAGQPSPASTSAPARKTSQRAPGASPSRRRSAAAQGTRTQNTRTQAAKAPAAKATPGKRSSPRK